MAQENELEAFNIPRAIDGATLITCRLSIDTRIVNILKILLLVHELYISNKGD